jgi:Putative auto-transporter adhesin, head GIN domain
MNKLMYIALAMVWITLQTVSAQSWSTGAVVGEGAVVKQEISLPSFHGFDLGFSGDVIVTPGASQRVVIEGQQNIIDNIKRDVSGGTWRISFMKNVKEAKNVTVYITIPTVDYIGLSGSGTIRSGGKFSGLGDMDMALSGSGDITMDVEARATKLRISGSGDITVSGASQSLAVSISGSGDAQAADLVASSCEVQISGSGDASVHVNGELEASISGSGDVHYRGDASVKARISGSGEVVNEK